MDDAPYQIVCPANCLIPFNGSWVWAANLIVENGKLDFSCQGCAKRGSLINS